MVVTGARRNDGNMVVEAGKAVQRERRRGAVVKWEEVMVRVVGVEWRGTKREKREGRKRKKEEEGKGEKGEGEAVVVDRRKVRSEGRRWPERGVKGGAAARDGGVGEENKSTKKIRDWGFYG
ncbi:hypothetical protein GOBAR_AA09881 [Gossypium barbadense]|uniref:Uncharacterized protein n=1 Tax=Gossypium barbadense TaxID=3634 RepID=A0A2P5Y594_GOSBA|nr:hypothetical protein GOBAR_AA09881 [Gossypium barbadense]